MGKLEHYALDFDAIEPTIAEFFQDKVGITYSFEQVNEFAYKVSVVKENIKKPGSLIIYNKQGLYCMDANNGTPALRGLCAECRDFILQRLKIPNAVRQTFSIKGVDSELTEACLLCLGENYTLSDEKGDVQDARHFIVTDTHRSAVSVICYNNGTIYVQGAYTALFLKVITEISKETSAAPEAVVEELMNIAPLVQKRYETDINALIRKPAPLIDNHLDVMVLSSVILANSALNTFDFGPYAFGVLKTIEGLLALKLQPYFTRDSDPFSRCYEEDARGKQKLKANVHDFDAPEQAPLKKVMEDAYNFIVDNRNTSFHVKKLHVETSRILSEDEALDIIEDGIEYINELCDNW